MKTFYDLYSEITLQKLHKRLPGIAWLLLHLKCKCLTETEVETQLTQKGLTDEEWLKKTKRSGCISLCRLKDPTESEPEACLVWSNEFVRVPRIPKGWKKPTLAQFREEYINLYLYVTDTAAKRKFDFLCTMHDGLDLEHDSLYRLHMMYDSQLSEFIYIVRRLADTYLGGH